MTVTTDISPNIRYACNGETTEFAFPFRFLLNDDGTNQVAVYLSTNPLTPLTEGVDYTVTGAGNNTGGTVTMFNPPASGVTLAIVRKVPLTQNIDFTEGGDFPAESFENGMDKIVYTLQEVSEKLTRTLITSPTDSVTPAEMFDFVRVCQNNAQTAAAEAESAATRAAAVAQSAEEVLLETTAYVDEAKTEIDTAKDAAETAANDAVETINTTIAEIVESGGYHLSLGDMVPVFSLNTPGKGRVWADGTEYTKAAFPKVYDALLNGSIKSISYADYAGLISANGTCPIFAFDADNETFKVPTMQNVYVGSTLSESLQGTYVAAGLPGISGSVTSNGLENITATGIFKDGGKVGSSYTHNTSNGSSSNTFVIDAPDVYGNSDTVTPPTVLARWAVVMYSEAVSASAAQVAEFVNSLNGVQASKVDLSGSNISDAETFRNNIEAPCMPKQKISATSTSSQVGDLVGINDNVGAVTYTLPPGGTWFCYIYLNNSSQVLTGAPRPVVAAGGTTLSIAGGNGSYLYGFAWRIK